MTLEPGCSCRRAIGHAAPVGHSVHHQAIDRLGDGLVVTGRADDGTIEAVEMPGRWVVGVQWHPEDTAATTPTSSACSTRSSPPAAGDRTHSSRHRHGCGADLGVDRL